MPVIDGRCINCGFSIQVEEFPHNVVFLADGKPVKECPNCETELLYADVLGLEPDVEPEQ